MHSGLNKDEQQETVWDGPQTEAHCKITHTNNFSIVIVQVSLQDNNKTGVSTQQTHKAEANSEELSLLPGEMI